MPDMQKFYAGVGSRKTPEHVLQRMSGAAGYLQEQGWILRSGKALGADTAFEDGSDRMAAATDRNPNDWKEIQLPWRGYNKSFSRHHPGALPFTEAEEHLASHLHPNWGACSDSVRALHMRNGRVMYGHPNNEMLVKFLICWTPGGEVTGGTGQALRLAQHVGIPVFNLGLAKSDKELDDMLIQMDEYQARF